MEKDYWPVIVLNAINKNLSTVAKQVSGNQSGFASFPKHVSLQKGSPLSEDLNETHRRLETGH